MQAKKALYLLFALASASLGLASSSGINLSDYLQDFNVIAIARCSFLRFRKKSMVKSENT